VFFALLTVNQEIASALTGLLMCASIREQGEREMKITRIEIFNVSLPLKKPLQVAKMLRERSSNTIVKVETDEGISGYGEATFAHFFAGETQGSVTQVVDRFIAPALTGCDPMNIIGLIAKMDGLIAGNPFAKAAVETALWDIKGKALGAPVYSLLGGFMRNAVPVNHSISHGPAREMADQAVDLASQGFRTLKVYCGRAAPDSDLERIREIRKAVGDAVDLYVEFNQRWSLKTAMRLLPGLEELGVLFLEQPLRSHLHREIRILRERSSIPIALDESVFTPEDVAFVKQEALADIVNIYVLKAGGIYNARRALQIAETMGLDAFVGSLNELSISSMAGAHVSATISQLPYPCYLVGPMLHTEDILAEPMDIRDGMLHLPDRPGLGIEVEDRQLERFQV
jgi:muconate cycloisomerase